MNNDSGEAVNIAAWLELKELFSYMPLPGMIAAAEHLFSCVGLTMKARRTAMADEVFENLMLLRRPCGLLHTHALCYSIVC